MDDLLHFPFPDWWDSLGAANLGKMTPARDPKPGWSYRTGWSQTGVGLPNGLRRRKSGAPKFRNFGFSTKSQNMIFLRGFLNNPSVESVAESIRNFHRRISRYLPRGSVFFLESPIFLLILSPDFELGAECLPLDGLPLPGSGLKGRLVPLAFDLVLKSHDFIA